jgi:hypothetical protein
VQALSFFELKPAPESDTQIAGARVPYGLSLSFLPGTSLGGLRVLGAKAGKGLWKGRAAGLGGDDEWGRWNWDSQLAQLAVTT